MAINQGHKSIQAEFVLLDGFEDVLVEVLHALLEDGGLLGGDVHLLDGLVGLQASREDGQHLRSLAQLIGEGEHQ